MDGETGEMRNETTGETGGASWLPLQVDDRVRAWVPWEGAVVGTVTRASSIGVTLLAGDREFVLPWGQLSCEVLARAGDESGEGPGQRPAVGLSDADAPPPRPRVRPAGSRRGDS